jgi:hypothetical protein
MHHQAVEKILLDFSRIFIEFGVMNCLSALSFICEFGNKLVPLASPNVLKHGMSASHNSYPFN